MSRKACHCGYPHRRRASGNGGGDNRHRPSLVVDPAWMQHGVSRMKSWHTFGQGSKNDDEGKVLFGECKLKGGRFT